MPYPTSTSESFTSQTPEEEPQGSTQAKESTHLLAANEAGVEVLSTGLADVVSATSLEFGSWLDNLYDANDMLDEEFQVSHVQDDTYLMSLLMFSQ